MPFLKDEKKKLLLDRYLDIEWPNNVINLRCVHCKRVAIIHYVSKCQHLFCSICRKMLSDEGQWQCPQCQEHVTQLDDRNFDVELKIQKLRIFCPNKKYGCNNEDQLRNIPKHLMACVATRKASLPVESTGTNTMDAVVNELTYENAATGELKEGVNLKFSKQVNTFDDVNSQLKVLTDRMHRMEKKSEKRIMQLELAFGKCTEEFRSFKSLLESVNQRVKQNESHHQKVMEQMWFNMEKTRTKMASMTQEMETLPIQKSEEPNSMRVETYEWTIKDVAKKTPNETWRIISETFNFTGYPFQIRAKLKKQRIAKIYLEFNEGKSLTNLVQKNGFTTVKYIFKDQSDNLKKRDVILETNLLFYGCFGQKSLIFGRHLSPDHLSPPYVMNDCIKIQILFEPPSIDRSFVSNNGVLKWRVDNYEERIQESFYRDIWSPTFYTSPRGYRVKIRLSIKMTGIMTVYVCFLTGEHDNSLSVNFPHTTTVTLFNQLDPRKNIVETDQREDVNFYDIGLESPEFIEENGFVKDDSLICSVVIEPVISKWSTKWARQ